MTSTLRLMIGRCSARGCRYARRIAVEATGEQTDRFGNTRLIVTHRDRARAMEDAGPGFFSCPEHGRSLNYRPVVGTVSETPCDARCTGARGTSCDCQCGGANHGQDHS